MASALRVPAGPAILASALFASALFVAVPAAAADAVESRALASCRAELFAQFPDGAIRTHRVDEISGNSRRTRIAFSVTADRRYTFECATGRNGEIVTAELDPPRGQDNQLAAGQR